MSKNPCKISRWDQLKRALNNLSGPEFKEAMEKSDGILLDVRRQEEFTQGHLPNAANLDYLAYDFIDQMEQLDPEQTYLVYCRSGRRSIRACTLMQNGGFQKVYNLDGGLKNWGKIFEL